MSGPGPRRSAPAALAPARVTDERAAGSCPCSDLVRRAVGSGPPRLPPPAADKDFQPLTRCPEQPRRLPAPRGPGGRVGGHLKGPREEATQAWGPSARVAHSWTRLSASRPDPSGRVGRPRLLSPAFLSVSLQTRSLSPAIRAMAGSAAPPNPGPRAGTEAVASPHSSYPCAAVAFSPPATPAPPVGRPRGGWVQAGPGDTAVRPAGSHVDSRRRVRPTTAPCPSQGPRTSSEGAGASSRSVLQPRWDQGRVCRGRWPGRGGEGTRPPRPPAHSRGGQNSKGQWVTWTWGPWPGRPTQKCPQRGVPLRPLADANPGAPQRLPTNHCLFRCVANLNEVPHLKSNLTNLEEKRVF